MLSSMEVEYISLSKLVAKIMFSKQILGFIELKVRYPIHVNIDNVGAIFLANNETSEQKTKHINIHYHYVHEFVEDRIVKIIFVKSMDN